MNSFRFFTLLLGVGTFFLLGTQFFYYLDEKKECETYGYKSSICQKHSLFWKVIR